MTFAPTPLQQARTYIINTLGVASAAVGIVGDSAHRGGYHCGKDRVVSNDYSVVESSRDRNGLTDAASALDMGMFSKTVNGRSLNLRHFSLWLVEQCKAGTADTRDIREVIYSPDGTSVRRWDRLGRRSSGDDSHRWHTHISYFRDSESRDKTELFRRYVTGDDDVSAEDILSYDGVPNWSWRGEKDNPTVQTRYALWLGPEEAHAARVAGEAGLKLLQTVQAQQAQILAEQTAAKQRDVAILAAVKDGADAAAILAHIDDLAAQDRARDEATLAAVQALESGGATAKEIVDLLVARLTN